MESSAEVKYSTEVKSFPPVDVLYKGKADVNSRLIIVDGNILSNALQESNYPSSIVKPLVIDDTGAALLSMAHYDSIHKKIVINEESLIDGLRKVRNKEYQLLEGLEPNRIKDFLKVVSNFINPITAPYMFLRDQGAISAYTGNEKRHSDYIAAAQKGFVRTKAGQAEQLSPEESLEHAKHFFDGLLEKATPGLVGWILAHEYEHRNKVGMKLAVKMGSLILPFVAGGLAAKYSLPGNELSVGVVDAFPFGILGDVAGRIL